MEILPTHTCFTDVIEYVNTLFESEKSVEKLEALFIVHGIVTGSKHGRRYSHAWLEKDSLAIHAGWVNGRFVYASFDRDKYYAHIHVKEFTRYTVREALALEQKFGRPGPWERKYRRLCRDNN